MLPPWPIVNSPECMAHFPRLSSKNGRRGRSPNSASLPFWLLMHGRHSILNCGKDTLWARCSQGSRELAPWRGLQGDSTPLLKKILYLVGTWYMIRNFITHFRLKLLSRAHRPTHTKNMVRHIKTAFENLKNNKKTYDPPSAYQKKTWPTPYSTAPPLSVEIMNGPLRHSDWRVIHVNHHVATPHSVYRTNLLIYSQVHKRITGLSDYVIQ